MSIYSRDNRGNETLVPSGDVKPDVDAALQTIERDVQFALAQVTDGNVAVITSPVPLVVVLHGLKDLRAERASLLSEVAALKEELAKRTDLKTVLAIAEPIGFAIGVLSVTAFNLRPDLPDHCKAALKEAEQKLEQALSVLNKTHEAKQKLGNAGETP